MVPTGIKKWCGVFGIGFGLAIGALLLFIANAALPPIQREFSASISQLQWIITGMGISIVALEVTMGRLADHYGRLMIFLIGQLIFALSSLLCGWAPSIGFLIFGRVIQGVGLSIVLPVSMGLMVHQFAPAERGKAVGIWGVLLGVGMAFGPVVGGIIIELLSWRWIFYLTVPALVLSGGASWIFVTESKDKSYEGIDWSGLVLLMITITSLVLGVVEGPTWGWAALETLACFVLAAIGVILLILVERKVASPILPKGAFKNRTFVLGLVNNFFEVGVWWAIFFLMPLYLDNIRGESTLAVGLLLGVMAVPFAAVSSFVGSAAAHTGQKVWVVSGWVIWIGASVMVAFFGVKTTLGFIIPAIALLGLSQGFIWPPATTFTFSTLPKRMASTAAGVLATAQELGGTLGVAVVGAVFQVVSKGVVFPGLEKAGITLTKQEVATVQGFLSNPKGLAAELKHLGEQGVAKLIPLFQEGFLAGFSRAVWVLGGVAVVMLIAILFLMKGGKQEIVHAEDRS